MGLLGKIALRGRDKELGSALSEKGWISAFSFASLVDALSPLWSLKKGL
jgi:hypothetical protein